MGRFLCLIGIHVWKASPFLALNALPELLDQIAEALGERELFATLREESWDLRCFDISTGGGDADIGWRVIGHWQAKPYERVIAEVYHDDPRAAILAAIEAGTHKGDE